MWKLWRWYQNCLTNHPLKTQSISSGLIWGIGEYATKIRDQTTAMKKKHQIEGEEQELEIKWRDIAKSSFIGFAYVGPAGHFWYGGLDRLFRLRVLSLVRPNTMMFLGAKAALSFMVYDLSIGAAQITIEAFASGKSVSQVIEDLKTSPASGDDDDDDDEYTGLALSSYLIGNVAMFRYAPVRYQLLCSNSLKVLFCYFLPHMLQTNVSVRLLI